MTAFSEVKVDIDMERKTATVRFYQPHSMANLFPPSVSVSGVPWDIPGEQTETEIRELAIENAKAFLRQIA